MLDIRKRTGYLFLAVMMAQVILVSAQVQTKSGDAGAAGGDLRAVLARRSSGRRRWSTACATSGATTSALRGVRAENETLKRRVGRPRGAAAAGARAGGAQSEQLQALLDLKSQATLPTLAAEVIAGNPDPVMRTVTIDRGSADGVQADMAVIAPGGIVGRVIGPVARHAARVQLLIDRNAAAGALTERTRAGGMVVGVEANPPLRMELVSNLADVKPGDAVVASGVDGILSEGLPDRARRARRSRHRALPDDHREAGRGLLEPRRSARRAGRRRRGGDARRGRRSEDGGRASSPSSRRWCCRRRCRGCWPAGSIAVNLVLVAVVYLALSYGAVTGTARRHDRRAGAGRARRRHRRHRRHDEDDDRVRWSACSARSSTCRRRCRGW